MYMVLNIEIVGREWFGSPPGAIPIVQHMTLWITFLGAALAMATRGAGADIYARGRRHQLPVPGERAAGTDRFTYGDTVAWGIPVWGLSAIVPRLA